MNGRSTPPIVAAILATRYWALHVLGRPDRRDIDPADVLLAVGALQTMTEKSPVFYEPSTDTMAIEIRPWPGGEDENSGGEDAGPDLVIHYAPDGAPWLWEIEHASAHPEHIAAALAEFRRLTAVAA